MSDLVRKKNRQALIITVSCILLIIAAFVWQGKISRMNRYDENTLCPINVDVSQQTIVLIDKSDLWELDDIQRIKNELIKIYESIHFQERLTLITLNIGGEIQPSRESLFDKCNPGTSKECNAIYQNCRRINKRYQEEFIDKIEKDLEIIIKPEKGNQSPLFESVVQVIDDCKTPKLKLHLVSDLMENGRKFNFYDMVPLYKEIISEYPIDRKEIQVSVFAHLIERNRHSRELIDAIKNTWRNYFEQQRIPIKIERLVITD